MPYELHSTNDPKKVAEQEYVTGDEIQFTKFLSCMGVMALTADNKIKGVHLVIVGKEGEFDDAAAKAVAALFSGCRRDSVVFIGQLAMWEDERGAPYRAMETALAKTLGRITKYERNDGIYGGKIKNGKIEVTEQSRS